MRAYETAFLIAPNLPEDETEELIQQMAEIVTQKKGKMVDLDKWGKRKLAYQIQKFDAAFYVFFRYMGEPDIPMELERRFKQTEAILRYLTVVMEEEGKVRIRKKGRPSPRPDRRAQAPEAEHKPKTPPPAEPRPEPEPKSEPKPESPPKPDAEAEPESEPKPDSEPAPETKPEAESTDSETPEDKEK
jgi:small subunit ribosomal protein S6